MDIKEYIKKYNLPFDKIKTDYALEFDALYQDEKEWLSNLEDKIHLLNNDKSEQSIQEVIKKLKNNQAFDANDTSLLSVFVSKINTLVSIANRINNFKEGTILTNGNTLRLSDFFNKVALSNSLKACKLELNDNLNNFLPHIYSVIKHCQNPINYPIYYKFWKNILREVLSKEDDYDSMCSFYASFQKENRHLNFATYFGTIGFQIAKNINQSGLKLTKDSKEYKYLTTDVINIERYNSILDDAIGIAKQYFLVGAYWDDSSPADQSSRFKENGIWENGYDDKFTDEVNSVPVGSKIAVKAAFTREKIKSVMAIKARGTVLENNNDGKTLVVEWDENFIPFEVDFSGGYWATIKEVTNKEHIEAIFYNNSTNANTFELTKGKFQVSIFDNYINLLRRIISELKIQSNDQRIVYSIRDKRLNFTVGQRYCFNLYASNSRGVYGVISKTKLLDNSESYDGTPPQPFYNYFTVFNPSSLEWASIIESIKEELTRTSKSSFKKYNNIEFENYVFANELTKNNNQMNLPLNSILYGPPGTGKTYNTILRAAEIVEKRKIDSYQEALKIFNENLHNRIEFLTFHQNYSYEDFIQGLRPETDNKSSLTFEKKDGVFKRIADRAKLNPYFIPVGTELKDYKVIKSSDDIIELWSERTKSIRYVPPQLIIDLFEGIKSNKITLEDIKKRRDLDLPELINSKVEKYYFGIEGTLYNICEYLIENEKSNKPLNYVIIIDEINRANISRVFGELITLIEPDKRSQGSIPLQVKLPSGDLFSVPSNLYIIGTMNTADKSIALLDIALRRRFEFESMYPLYEIKGSEIYDKDILLKINEQIIKSKGHDFQIGHAYFMGENSDLVQRINKKVIPLLLEYFMNDEKEVKGILYNAGLQVEENSWPIKITGKRA